ncbi:MAG: hypothetical protein ACI4PZ_03340 [Akkermansia sp.]
MSTPDFTYIERDPQFGDCNPGSDFDPSVYQYYSDTCAIQSQKLILEKFGIHKTEEELIQDAKLHGWYSEGYGTPTTDVGKLLDLYGIKNEASINNNIFSLANELAQHKQVIVSVDSKELWGREGFYGDVKDWFCGEHPDHALIVAGVDTSDPGNVKVVLTDPGTGQLRVTYTEEEFMSAWKDSNCFMTSTDLAPEQYLGTEYIPETHFAGFETEQLCALGNANLGEVDADEIINLLEMAAAGATALATCIHAILQITKDAQPALSSRPEIGFEQPDTESEVFTEAPLHEETSLTTESEFAPFE